MPIRKFFNFSKKEGEILEGSLISVLKKIKEGDSYLREKFIIDHKPFILKTVSKVMGKFIDDENNDEFSIGLEAFNEAINCFDLNMKSNFFSFAEQVIRRRIIDDIRKRRRENRTTPFSNIDEYEDFEAKYLTSDSYFKYEHIEVEEEISVLKNQLAEYGINMVDLAANSPKHEDSRNLCIKIARILAQDEVLYRQLVKSKNIPRNELLKKVPVHRRTIENNRKFIIAVCLILRSNLEISKRLFKYAEEGGE